jgi:hypothetical protein
MADGFCIHYNTTFNEDTYRYDHKTEKRDIFKCDEHKSEIGYSDYKAKSKPITNNLAPITALPKHSKGDNPRYRFKQETARGKVSLIKTVDARGNEHYYKLTKKGFKAT